MIEDKALVDACLLAVGGGRWLDLKEAQLDVLESAGWVETTSTPSNDTPTAEKIFGYKLTQAGHDRLWPPQEK
ncbi:hypothetical protein LJR099_003046 [Variovorax paradoxus]|uniref:hypothetical protein n=1 Tax=Variovorax paradoxus TaxID=34073 RepID=UPI00399A4DF4